MREKLTTKDFIEKSKLIHGDKYDYSKVIYKGNKEKVKIICPKHDEFFQTPSDHKQGKGCSKCKMSKGEFKIMNYLNDNNIKFYCEYRFSNCRDKLPLPFDFYLPNYNMCIEYDGEQHFKEVKIWNGVIGLSERIKKDKIKNEYCLKNNIKLLRIKYNENIIDKLKAYL